MDTLLLEGTRKTSRAPGGERCGCFVGDSAFERCIYTKQPVQWCTHARRRAEGLKTLKRDTQGFRGFSSVPNAR